MNRIGIFSKREQFAQDLLQHINAQKIDNIRAEFAVVGETRFPEKSPYRVVVDRISGYVPYFKTYFTNAALSGSYVINNPFGLARIDRFHNYSRVKKLGFAVPRTVCLPTREYHPDCSTSDLQNLKYPLDWEDIGDFVGFPAILKPYDGYGFRDTYTVNSIPELVECYNGTGTRTMLMQEFINYDCYVKTYVAGGDDSFTLKYNPSSREYSCKKKDLKGLPIDEIVDGARDIAKNLEIDFYAVEFAMKDDTPYVVNFLDPYPDCRKEALLPECYDWCIERFSHKIIDCALSGKTSCCEPALINA